MGVGNLIDAVIRHGVRAEESSEQAEIQRDALDPVEGSRLQRPSVTHAAMSGLQQRQ